MGSSPRMRGKRVSSEPWATQRRLIPAHAGKTNCPALDDLRHWAHPRACGENLEHISPNLKPTGSSPRMRGKRPGRVFIHSSMGLIPAHAGKTVNNASGKRVSWAHPRACGENLARGGVSLTPPWLIPAHAGKTVGRDALVGICPAHPRACGENAKACSSEAMRSGSSPRMRGKLKPDFEGQKPTLAHPRACGENHILLFAEELNDGSSPRMRGKQGTVTSDVLTHGLIPAHAGKTHQSEPSPLGSRAHPRACGENRPSASLERIRAGSSPRMRGKPDVVIEAPSYLGLIPAHAGKTSIPFANHEIGPAHPRACGEN